MDGLARVIAFLKLDPNVALSSISTAVNEFCSTPYADAITTYGDNPVDTLTMPAYCFEGAYAFEFLTYGIGFPEDSQQILFVDEYFGVDVSWALGAMVDQVATTLNENK